MSTRSLPDAARVDDLDLDSLPPGIVHRLLIGLVDDQVGGRIRVPVLVARGERPGPVVGLTAALHGNELNGIPVIHRLFEGLDVANLRGTVAAVVVANVPGFKRRQRTYMDGLDLNHHFPGKKAGNGGQAYAWNLVHRVIDRFDLLIDLHTASVGRVNCLYVRADLTDARTADMAWRIRPDIVLHNPANDKTLRGTSMGRGIPAITVEIGNPQRFHPEYIRHAVTGIRRVLAAHDIVPKRKPGEGRPPIICKSSKWMYTDRGGLLEVLPGTTDRVEKGEVVARMRDIFGDPIIEYKAPFDGVVIGHSVDPVAESGARILHLGALADGDDQRLLNWPHEIPAQAPELEPRPLWETP
ncbi:MAG: succinylglutamate desuccinylase/aspartoacylase family protein [Alphaproteobacteria bacterium]|nr:succinylglutamate desuccinylase/aspartoacylase family protein [Alphaproteobacteria bacterium]